MRTHYTLHNIQKVTSTTRGQPVVEIPTKSIKKNENEVHYYVL
jgi:hypothetical protein